MMQVLERTTTSAPEGRAADVAPLIVARGLTKAYDTRATVLQGIDLEIQEGERVALIGANGSGKSTLLKSLIGLHSISDGTLSCFGHPVGPEAGRAQRLRMRRQTGFVFQKHCLVRRRSVLSNVIHGLFGEPGSWRAFSHSLAPLEWRNRAMQALADVDLEHKALHRADALSGGQQQRVAIARAIVRRPRLLIADEPAASLDPLSGHNVMELFTHLCRTQGITLIYTSHDMAHAMDYADRIVALKRGKVFFDRPVTKVAPADLKDTFDD